jgi:hypothetical protein
LRWTVQLLRKLTGAGVDWQRAGMKGVEYIKSRARRHLIKRRELPRQF